MGYGEFDGGGSMDWKVKHGKGGSGGGKGKDEEETIGKPLAICFNGVQVWTITCYTNMPKVFVTWGDDNQCPPTSATQKKTGKAGKGPATRQKSTAKKR